MKRKVLSVFVLVVLSLFVGLAEGVTLDRTMQAHAAPSTPAAASTPAVAAPDFELIKQAWDTLQQHYVDRSALDSKQLTYAAISGMVDSLGDTGHSRFLTPEMVRQEDDFNQGQFEGIGAEVDSKDGNLTIVAPIDGSPAQKAGLNRARSSPKWMARTSAGYPWGRLSA